MADVGLTENDDGRTIDVQVGDSVTIVLAENPTTGYRWVHDTDAQPIAALSDSSFESARSDEAAPPDETVGGGGTRRFSYLIAHHGTGRLTLHHRQAWDEQSTTDTFSLTLVCKS